MSNIKLIDGRSIPMDKLYDIYLKPQGEFKYGEGIEHIYLDHDGTYKIGFELDLHYQRDESRFDPNIVGDVVYNTESEAKARLKEILEKQNSNDIEI